MRIALIPLILADVGLATLVFLVLARPAALQGWLGLRGGGAGLRFVERLLFIVLFGLSLGLGFAISIGRP